MTTLTNRKVQVHRGSRPNDDRYVSMTTQRVYATDVLVVAVVDGTNRLADPKTLRATTDLSRARRWANDLCERMGGPVDELELRDVLPPNIKEPIERRSAPRDVTRVLPPTPGRRLGFTVVRWTEHGIYSRYRRFKTTNDATDFYQHLIQLKENR